MPAIINPIRNARLKKELLNPKNSQAEAMRRAGFANSTAHSRVGDCKSLKIVKAQILQEMEDSQLITKAYNALNNCLSASKDSDKIAAAQALLRFKVGEKSNINNLNPEKIVVAYGAPQNVVNITAPNADVKVSDKG